MITETRMDILARLPVAELGGIAKRLDQLPEGATFSRDELINLIYFQMEEQFGVEPDEALRPVGYVGIDWTKMEEALLHLPAKELRKIASAEGIKLGRLQKLEKLVERIIDERFSRGKLPLSEWKDTAALRFLDKAISEVLNTTVQVMPEVKPDIPPARPEQDSVGARVARIQKQNQS